jgi:hypothetical protein
MHRIKIRKQQSLKITMKPARRFQRYTKVACSAARHVSRKSGRKIQEMNEEAISYLGLVATDWDNFFDPTRGVTPCTRIYSAIRWYLVNICCRSIRKREIKSPDTDLHPAKINWLERLSQELGDEALSLIKIILETPNELVKAFRGHPTQARLALITYLQETGWTDEQIDAAWSEVQSCL